jgi:hypothetical protein
LARLSPDHQLTPPHTVNIDRRPSSTDLYPRVQDNIPNPPTTASP